MKNIVDTKKVELCVQSSKAYYNNIFRGNWINLPVDEKDLDEFIKGILLDEDDNLIVTDSTAPFRIEEYTNIKELNKVLNECTDYRLFITIMGAVDNDIQQAIKVIDENKFTVVKGKTNENPDYHILEIEELDDVARLMCNKDLSMSNVSRGYVDKLGSFPQHLLEYIDYDAIATHLETGLGWTIISSTKVAICLNHYRDN